MKSIYKITKGQLISLWVFGIIAWFYAIDSYSDFAGFLTIFIPAILVFYTIGWRNVNRKINNIETKEHGQKVALSDLLPNKKIVGAFLLVIVILFIGGYAYSEISKKNEQKKYASDLKQRYENAIANLDNLKNEATQCVKPFLEEKYQEELRSCNLLRGKVKHDYNFCVSLTSINSPASCLYDHDYEKIDCSEAAIKEKVNSTTSKYSLPKQCLLLVNEVEEANFTIEEYSKIKK